MGDYILGTDRQDFYNVCIRDPRLFTDHQMILAELRGGGGERRNHKYCMGGTSCTIAAPNRGPMQEEDATFNDLQKEVKKPTHTSRYSLTWVSELTCSLSDQSTSLRWRHPVEKQGIRKAMRCFRASLQ